MLSAIAARFATSKLGRFIMAAAGIALAIVTFGAWQRRKGRVDEHQRQVEADHAAIRKADAAGAQYRAGGDVADRMRRGEF